MTGWNLPPGCSVNDLPGNADYPCAICWEYESHCQCPECPECSNIGDPNCYLNHNLKLTPHQIDTRLRIETQSILDNEAECAYWDSHYKDMEDYENEGPFPPSPEKYPIPEYEPDDN